MSRRPVLVAAALIGLHCSRFDTPDPRPTPARPAVARIVSVHGTVKVRPFGVREWRVAREGLALVAGDALRTWAGSRAELRYIDGMVLTIQADTHVEIDSVEATELEGQVRFAVPAEDDTTLRAKDNTLEAVPGHPRRGTLETTPDGGAVLNQSEGRSRLRTPTEQRAIGPQQGVDVGKDGRMGPVRALLPAPSLIAPIHNAVLAMPDPARSPVPFTWTAVPGATGYRVKVHGDIAAAGAIFDRVVPGTQTTLVADPLPAGVYYWEMSTILGDKEGVSSDLSTFTVRAAPGEAGPPLLIDRLTPQGNTVYIEGRTDEAARLTINGQAVGVDGEGRFREHIAVPPSRRLVLHATSPQGGASEKTITVPPGR